MSAPYTDRQIADLHHEIERLRADNAIMFAALRESVVHCEVCGPRARAAIASQNVRQNVGTVMNSDNPRDEIKEIPGKLEWFEGVLCEVKNPSRSGWWRFHENCDRDGYCDNPARGY